MTPPKSLLVVPLIFSVACGTDHDRLAIDPEPRPDRPGEVQEDAAAAEIPIEVAEVEQEAVLCLFFRDLERPEIEWEKMVDHPVLELA